MARSGRLCMLKPSGIIGGLRGRRFCIHVHLYDGERAVVGVWLRGSAAAEEMKGSIMW